MFFWLITITLLYTLVSTVSQVKCDALDGGGQGGATSNRSETDDATWSTLWDGRGRTYKYLNVNGRDDESAASPAGERRGRDSALVTLLLSLRVAGGGTDGNRHKLAVAQRANVDVQKRDSAAAAAAATDAMTSARAAVPDTSTAAANATTTTTTTTTTVVTPPKEIEKDVWTTTTAVYPLASTARSPAANLTSGPADEPDPIVKSARDPSADTEDDELPDAEDADDGGGGGGGSPRDPVERDVVQLKIVLTVRSSDAAAAADGDGENRATTARRNRSDMNFTDGRRYVVHISDP